MKAVLAIAISSRTGSPCAQWDSATAQALSYPAFQPFTWPFMRDTSATYVDLKFFYGNEVLFHWVFRGYCSDSDMSVQQQFCDEGSDQRRSHWQVPTFGHCGGVHRVEGLCALVRGRRTIVLRWTSWNSCCRGSLPVQRRALSDRSVIVGRLYGNDADRVEFRFRDANKRRSRLCSGNLALAQSHFRAGVDQRHHCLPESARSH